MNLDHNLDNLRLHIGHNILLYITQCFKNAYE
jgi:hypothetical protein